MSFLYILCLAIPIVCNNYTIYIYIYNIYIYICVCVIYWYATEVLIYFEYLVLCKHTPTWLETNYWVAGLYNEVSSGHFLFAMKFKGMVLT